MTARLQQEYTISLGRLITICGSFLIPGLLGIYAMLTRLTTLENNYANHIETSKTKTTEIYTAIDKGDKANADAIEKTNTLVVGVGTQVGNLRVDVARLTPYAVRATAQ
jgi:hypothetical protein